MYIVQEGRDRLPDLEAALESYWINAGGPIDYVKLTPPEFFSMVVANLGKNPRVQLMSDGVAVYTPLNPRKEPVTLVKGAW